MSLALNLTLRPKSTPGQGSVVAAAPVAAVAEMGEENLEEMEKEEEKAQDGRCSAEEKAKKLKAKKEKDEAKKIERKARIKRGHLAQKGLDKLWKEEKKAENLAEERAERKRQIAIDHKPCDPLELGSSLLPFAFQSMRISK